MFVAQDKLPLFKFLFPNLINDSIGAKLELSEYFRSQIYNWFAGDVGNLKRLGIKNKDARNQYHRSHIKVKKANDNSDAHGPRNIM